MSEFGERIKQARTRANLSQESLADKVGLTKGAISQWEVGISQSCKIDTLFLLSDALMVDARWLALGKGEPTLTKEMPHHIQLARAIDAIPKDAREPMVKLIQSIASASEERFWKWAKEVS